MCVGIMDVHDGCIVYGYMCAVYVFVGVPACMSVHVCILCTVCMYVRYVQISVLMCVCVCVCVCVYVSALWIYIYCDVSC